MGKVAASIKIMPESEDINVDSIIENLKKLVIGDYYIGSIGLEELAFGLKAIKLVAVMDDREGLIDRLENMIRGIKGVGELEVEEVSLIS